MQTLEFKKKQLELQRVTTALLDLEVKAIELRLEADRLDKHMEISMAKQEELEKELSLMKGDK